MKITTASLVNSFRICGAAAGQVLLLLLISSFVVCGHDNPKTLAIGSRAPDFNLEGIDGKMYSLQSFKEAKVLVVVFTCNHCPTAQAYEERMKSLVTDYKDRKVELVAIMPNYAGSLRYDELGWSDEPDDFEGMKRRAKDRAFNFPYLYDGDTEETALKYGPVSTPHVFIFDQNRILRYTGRIDDEENFRKPVRSQDARNAIEALLQNQPVPVQTTRTFGCSIKWKSKSDWLAKADEAWAKKAVKLDIADPEDVDATLKNTTSGNLRLIYFWSEGCKACETAFPEYVKLARIYQEREFELVTICAGDSTNFQSVLAFLEKQQSAGDNKLYTEDLEKIKPLSSLSGEQLPYTILVEPGGKIVFSKQGLTDPEFLRRMIFNDPYMGRLFR